MSRILKHDDAARLGECANSFDRPFAAGNKIGRAKPPGELKLFRQKIYGDDLGRPGYPAPLDDIQANPAGPVNGRSPFM